MTSTVSVSVPLPGIRIRWLATGALAALLTIALGAPALSPRPALASDSSTSPQHTISVQGTGRVVLTPDVADIRLGVMIQRSTVAQAQQDAATAMSAVIAALKATGIADKDIQTSSLSLQPVYDYNTKTAPPKLIGYQLTNEVTATVRNLGKLADAIDGSLKAGATTMDGVTFRLQDQTAAEKQARIAAIADARAKADTLAGAANVTITGVSSISETSATQPMPIAFGAAPSADRASTPVQPGTLDVEIDVAVVYLIN